MFERSVAKELSRKVDILEYEFQEEYDMVVGNIDCYIEGIKEAIEYAEEGYELYREEILNLSDAIQELYFEADDETLFQKIRLFRLRRIANREYANSLDEMVKTHIAKERLKKLLKRLEVIKAFRN